MINKRSRVLGIILIIASIISMYYWEKWGRDKYLYNEILIYTKDIETCEILDESMLTTARVNYVPPKALKPEDIKSVLGLAAKCHLNKGNFVFATHVEKPDLLFNISDEKYVMTIPREWMKNCPKSIKRGDKVYFYHGEKFITEATVFHVKDSSNQEVQVLDTDRLNMSANVDSIEVLVEYDQIEILNQEYNKGEEIIVLYNR